MIQPIIVSGIECDPNLWSAAQLARDYNPLHGGTIRECATKNVYKEVCHIIPYTISYLRIHSLIFRTTTSAEWAIFVVKCSARQRVSRP